MRAQAILPCLAIALLAASAPWAAPPPEERATATDLVAPAFRVERHTAAAEAYLKALPDGTRIVVDRADGSHFELALSAGTLTIDLPPSSIDLESATVTTPLGYEVGFGNEGQRAIVVTAPSGAFAEFRPTRTALRITESDGGTWNFEFEGRPLRLPDGTRIDPLDKGSRWEILTLHGERFQAVLEGRAWSQLDPVPSPPLIPDPRSAYLSGDGDDWRLSVWEDDTVFAWNWVRVGLSIERALADVREGHRRKDIEYYFLNLDRVQPPPEVAAALLGRRLALIGGDRMTFDVPGREPVTAFLLPGPIEPDYIIPRGKGPPPLTPRTMER